MTLEHDKLTSLLFPAGEGMKLANFKLFRSAGNPVSESHIRQEIHSALFQAWVSKTAKPVHEFPLSDAPKVNVAEMLERI